MSEAFERLSAEQFDFGWWALLEMALTSREARAMRHCIFRYRWQRIQDQLRREAAELRSRT